MRTSAIQPPLGTPINKSLSNGLFSYWPLNEGGGQLSIDNISHNHGTLTNGCVYKKDTRGNCITFTSASNQFVSTPSVIQGIASAFSISAWIKTSTGAVQQILTKDPGGSDRFWQFRVDADGTVRLVRFSSANGVLSNFNSAGFTVNNGVFRHVATVFNSSVGSAIYIDGVSRATDAVLTANNNNTSAIAPTLIGGRVVNESFNGSIMDVRLYNRALSATEIRQLYVAPYSIFQKKLKI